MYNERVKISKKKSSFLLESLLENLFWKFTGTMREIKYYEFINNIVTIKV